MNLLDTVSLSYRTIRANKLRTGLTVSIIALGIAALIGIRTAIEAMTQKFTESFSSMGANGYSIRFKSSWNVRFNVGLQKEVRGRRKERKSNTNKPITSSRPSLSKRILIFLPLLPYRWAEQAMRLYRPTGRKQTLR